MREKIKRKMEEREARIKRNSVKHSCPSGLRGSTQDRLSRDAWVRTPPDAF